MKRFVLCAMLMAASSIPAFAVHYTATVHVDQDMYMGATKLSRGDYKVIADGAGNNVMVTLLQNGKQIVKTQAKVVDQKNNSEGINVTNKNGKDVVEGILLKEKTLLFTDEAVK